MRVCEEEVENLKTQMKRKQEREADKQKTPNGVTLTHNRGETGAEVDLACFSWRLILSLFADLVRFIVSLFLVFKLVCFYFHS